MKKRCPKSKSVGKGELKDYKLAFTAYSQGWNGGVADVVKEDGKEVWGLLYEITKSDLDSLDYYEGYPDKYTRSEKSIYFEDGKKYKAIVYEVKSRKEFIQPSKEYVTIILKAARNFNFPKKYIHYIIDITNWKE
jgi:gamma-glutamylcyclotransferase (GGCT)/AIG2-like uncharacterized protein YtfP